jgi:TPR repeat protein
VPQNPTLAAHWYKKAAEAGHAKAQNNLGYLYESGEGLAQDSAESLIWYTKAAEQGVVEAQHNLGFMYETGLGVQADAVKAFRWYTKAAEQNFAVSQHNLAEFVGITSRPSKGMFMLNLVWGCCIGMAKIYSKMCLKRIIGLSVPLRKATMKLKPSWLCCPWMSYSNKEG